MKAPASSALRAARSVRVVFIGGSGRSGSTLVDRTIGQVRGFVSTGEVRDVWRAGLGENRLCGCGREFDQCPFWQRVGDAAFGGWSTLDRADADALVASYGYGDAIRSLVSGRRPSSHRRVFELLERLYAGIADAADGATIVDSSKGPAYAVALSLVPRIDFRVIHLVRDSRGVAYSWSKEVTRPDTPGRVVHMPRLSAAGVSARWIAHNSMMELLGRRVPTVRLRYESFATKPAAELARVLRDLGIAPEPSDLGFLGDGVVRLEANHTVMGNPMRMATGEVRLRVDDAWRTQMSRARRAQVTAATLPMLIRYGYVQRRRTLARS